MRYAVVLFLSALLLAVVRSPAPLSAQSPLRAATLQATSVPQNAGLSQAITPVPTTVETTAPIGERTQQVLLIIGVALVITLILGGGIYLRRWWLANRW